MAERKRLLEQAVEAGIDPEKTLGLELAAGAFADSVELTRHAIQLGCAGGAAHASSVLL